MAEAKQHTEHSPPSHEAKAVKADRHGPDSGMSSAQEKRAPGPALAASEAEAENSSWRTFRPAAAEAVAAVVHIRPHMSV